MAAQRVQAYLDKHKIGPLFEDLMAKVIQDMPGNPVNYLIRVLQKKESKLTGKPVPSQTTPLRASAVTWAKGVEVGRRGIATASLKSEKKTLMSRETSLRKSAGNARPGVTNRLTASSSPALSTPSRHSHLTPADHIHVAASGTDTIDDELSVLVASKRAVVSERNVSKDTLSKQAKLSRKARMDERRKELASLLSTSTSNKQSPKTTSSDSDSVTDEGVDLIEDADDLVAEGVSNVSSGSGSRKRQVSSSVGIDQQNVKIQVCARCARLIDNGEQNAFDTSSVVTVSSRGGGYASSGVTLADDERDDFFFTQRRVPTRTEDSDDDFESASQVTPHTPRMPTWPASDRGGNSNSRIQDGRGKHQSTSIAKNSNRGQHMYRRGGSIVDTMLSQSGRSHIASGPQTLHTTHASDDWEVFDSSHVHHSDLLPSAVAVATSTPVTGGRRSEDEEDSESDETPRVLDQWQRADDGSDSSALWHSSGQPTQKHFRTQGHLNQMLADSSDSEPQMRSLHTVPSGRQLADDELALNSQGLRGSHFKSNDFSQTGDESDEELDQTHRTYTRSPLGSEL